MPKNAAESNRPSERRSSFSGEDLNLIADTHSGWKEDLCEQTKRFCDFDSMELTPLTWDGSGRRTIRSIWICRKCKRLYPRDVAPESALPKFEHPSGC